MQSYTHPSLSCHTLSPPDNPLFRYIYSSSASIKPCSSPLHRSGYLLPWICLLAFSYGTCICKICATSSDCYTSSLRRTRHLGQGSCLPPHRSRVSRAVYCSQHHDPSGKVMLLPTYRWQNHVPRSPKLRAITESC